MTIIEGKQRKATADYIRRYNANEKYTKTIRKMANQYSQDKAQDLVM